MEVRHETERPLLTKRNENFCKCICISINNIDQKFSFTFGSHYNPNCVINPQRSSWVVTQLSSDYVNLTALEH